VAPPGPSVAAATQPPCFLRPFPLIPFSAYPLFTPSNRIITPCPPHSTRPRPSRPAPRPAANLGHPHFRHTPWRHLGGKKLQQLTKADGDALVEWMLTQGRRSVRHYLPNSLSSRVADLISLHPEGITAAEIKAAFPGQDVRTCLSGLLRAGRITRPRRAVYVAAEPAVTAGTDTAATSAASGVKPVTVRSTLTTFGMVVQSFVDQGTLARNVIALVERPADPITDDDDDTSNHGPSPRPRCSANRCAMSACSPAGY
jgi:hypothetical protein